MFIHVSYSANQLVVSLVSQTNYQCVDIKKIVLFFTETILNLNQNQKFLDAINKRTLKQNTERF